MSMQSAKPREPLGPTVWSGRKSDNEDSDACRSSRCGSLVITQTKDIKMACLVSFTDPWAVEEWSQTWTQLNQILRCVGVECQTPAAGGRGKETNRQVLQQKILSCSTFALLTASSSGSACVHSAHNDMFDNGEQAAPRAPASARDS